MGTFLILIIVVVSAFVAITLFRVVKRPLVLISHEENIKQSNETTSEPDLSVLNCRIRLSQQNKENGTFDTLNIEICGSIHAPDDMHNAALQITVTDLTDGIGKPVHSTVRQWQMQHSPEFCYKADLGRVPERITTLSNWMAVAQINSEWLVLPRRGKRNLQFTTSILSRQSGRELAAAKSIFPYENPAWRYVDLEENIRRTKTLAVTLAFAVSASDNKLYDCEVEVIKSWARENIDTSLNAQGDRDTTDLERPAKAANKVKRKLEKTLKKTVLFFRNGSKVDTYKICDELVRIAPLVNRYDILELCLHVTQAKGFATAEELALLKKLAIRLEVDMNRFRAMTDRILPADMHAVKDKEIILGVTSDMSEEQTREHLNREYRKWNARVTNSNPEVRIQADHMLRFIAETRSAYAG